MTGGLVIDPAPRNSVEIAIEVVWDHVERMPPWEFVLRAAGWHVVVGDRWSKAGIDATLSISGTGCGSFLLGADDPQVWERPGIWTCDQVLVHWVYGGNSDAARSAMLNVILDQLAGREGPRLPQGVVDAVVMEWSRLSITPIELGATSKRTNGATDSSGLLLADPPIATSGGTRQEAGERTLRRNTHPAGYGCPPLDAVYSFCSRYLVLPSPGDYVVLALWVAHTFLISEFDVTPRLAVLSPQPGSGKTRVLDLIGVLALNPVQTVSLTPAALFRRIAGATGKTTLLLDEVDTIFGPGSSNSDEIKSIVNGGYRRGGTVMRSGSEKKNFTPEHFDVFAPVAMAGLGTLPATLMSRCVVLRMHRRRPDEPMEVYRPRDVMPETADLRSQLALWAAGIQDELSYPPLPDALTDRAAEIWEPLLAVAQAAGPGWFDAACVAAVAAVAGPGEGRSSDTMLLEAIKDIFDEMGKDKLESKTLLQMLSEHDGVATRYTEAKALARALGGYKIAPRSIRFADTVQRGYYRRDFEDTWSRYLREAATPATAATTAEWEPCTVRER